MYVHNEALREIIIYFMERRKPSLKSSDERTVLNTTVLFIYDVMKFVSNEKLD